MDGTSSGITDAQMQMGTELRTSMRVSAAGNEVAGSIIRYDGLQRSGAQLLGVSDGTRASEWHYDARGRLESSAHAKRTQSAMSLEVLTPADFRQELRRPEPDAAAPPSISFTEKVGGGHKIDAVTRGSSSRQLAWGGSELVDDGQFLYEFDSYSRLVKVTEKVLPGASSLSVRRIHYSYSPANRMVGRRAEYAPLPSAGTPPLETDWKLEDRGDVLAADAIPAEATFVWDPLSDTIAAVFKAGASSAVNGGDPNGGLVRQIIHGGLSYDDPIEVTAVDPNSAGGALARLYPIYEAQMHRCRWGHSFGVL